MICKMKTHMYSVKKVQNPHEIKVRVPGSKSITNRALLIAALAEGTSILHGVLFSDDSRYFLQALVELGFPVEIKEAEQTVVITGFGGKIPAISAVDVNVIPEAASDIYVGSAGTAARFLTAFLGLSAGNFRIDASKQMKARPMKELLLALEELGAEVSYQEEEYHFPLVIGNKGCHRQSISIDVGKSSQFLSALLISSVLFREDFEIHVEGSHGMAYVNMTVAMMEQFGVSIEVSGNCYKIAGTASYFPREYQIEPDLSAAGYFYAMSPALNIPVCVEGVHEDSLQGDIQFLSVLEDMGCRKQESREGIILNPPAGAMKGGAWDFSAFSDQALTLAAIAPFAESEVRIMGISHIRYQECDRIEAMISNLKRMGITAEESKEKAGEVRIMPGTPQPAEIETYDDHRVAMSFAVTGLCAEGIRIKNPLCCRKTFENFFEVLENEVY